MIEQDGDETVYATGGVVRPEPFIARDIRSAIEALRDRIRDGADVSCGRRLPVVTDPIAVVRAMDEWLDRFCQPIRTVTPKTYSPLRRWLRAERAREHREAIAADVETVMEWRPSRVPAVEIASRLWRVPVSVGVDEALPGSDRSVEIRYIGGGRYEMGETDPRPPSGGTGGGGFKGPFR